MAASKLLRNEFPTIPMTDAEMLRFLFKAIKPDVVTIISQAMAKKLGALSVCLMQQERLIVDSPNFLTKEAVLQNITAARLLCDMIQAELEPPTDAHDARGATQRVA